MRILTFISLIICLALSSCYKEKSDFEVDNTNQYYSEDSNLETLLREIEPDDGLKFTYDNQVVKSLNQPLELGSYNDRILFDLDPLLFLDRFDRVYRGKVDISIEYLTQNKDFVRRGFNTQMSDMSMIDLDFAFRLIFKDTKGYRLKIRDGGLPITLKIRTDEDAENLYSLDDADEGSPYFWATHSREEDIDLRHSEVINDNERFSQYDLNLLGSEWIALGRNVENLEYQSLCVHVENKDELLDPDKTIAFAVIGNNGLEIVQLVYDEIEGAFCSESYPKEKTSLIIMCSLDRYVDYFYSERFYSDFNTNEITTDQKSASLESIIDGLSSI